MCARFRAHSYSNPLQLNKALGRAQSTQVATFTSRSNRPIYHSLVIRATRPGWPSQSPERTVRFKHQLLRLQLTRCQRAARTSQDRGLYEA